MVRVPGFVLGGGDTSTDAEDALISRRLSRAHISERCLGTIRRASPTRVAMATIVNLSARRSAVGTGRHDLPVFGGTRLLT